MSTQQTFSEISREKRQRRIKYDPEFIFENPKFDQIFNKNKQNSSKITKKIVQLSDENSTGANLYQPGDIVWSKLGSFPWWPALIYRCDAEGGIYTRTFNSNNKVKRQFFVYFYGKYLEYSWLSTRSLLNYSGLENFIKHAEDAVEKASTKSEKVQLANRYQLKVSMKKRSQWDDAIALANRSLKMTRNERIKQFYDLLNQPEEKSKNKRKISSDKNSNEEIKSNKRIRSSLSTSFSFELPNETNNSIQFDKTKPGRKTKSQLNLNLNNNEILSKNTTINENFSFPLKNLIQSNIPPLSNYEQKQIAEGLLKHEQNNFLTFDQGQTFATNKAIEIVYENFNHRMDKISPEWFYDSILLKHPSIVFKYRSWFENVQPEFIPDGTDLIQLKQWQISLMIQAQRNAEK